jgi:uncharacterized coiled-coil protein SlyX
MYNMAKKITKVTEDVENIDIPVEIVENIVETMPTSSEELSPLIVSLQSEVDSLRSQINASRAEFVTQTDKQFAKIAELDLKIADKQTCVDNYTQICDVFLPAKQKELANANNEALKVKAEAETSLKEVLVREKTLEKATAKLAEQKELLDAQANDLNLLAETLNKKEKELNEREKASD